MVLVCMLLSTNIHLKVFCFVSTDGCGVTFTSKTYESHCMDCHENIQPDLIPLHKIVSSLFES